MHFHHVVCAIIKWRRATREFKVPEAMFKENNWVFKTTISAHKFIRHRTSILIFHTCARMQNSFCRLNILEIIVVHSFSFCNRAVFKSENPKMKWKFAHTLCEARKKHRTKICGNKINYGMIFVSFAKIGIKFFNFSFAYIHVHIQFPEMEADMIVNAQKPGGTIFL